MANVTAITRKLICVIAGELCERNRSNAVCAIWTIAIARNSTIMAAASVSYLRCPYGWLASGGLRAMRTPTSAATFEAASVSE